MHELLQKATIDYIESLPKEYTISPFDWVGGKYNMLKDILPLIPKSNYYVEPFGGSGKVIFNKKRVEVEGEIYNDIDRRLYIFFDVLRRRSEELLPLIFFSPVMLEDYKNSHEECEDELEKARRIYVQINYAFSPGRYKSGLRVKPLTDSKISSLLSVAKRIREITIMNLDALELMNKFDKENVFMYLDPPYPSETRKDVKLYNHETSDSLHENLISFLLKSKCRWLLSGYDCDQYKPIEHLKYRTYKRACTLGCAGDYDREEVLWSNYLKEEQLSFF